MAIQKKSLITNHAATKKAIIATNSASADFSSTRVATAKLAKAGGAKFAKGVNLAKGVHLAKGVSLAKGVKLAKGVSLAKGVKLAKGVHLAKALK